MYRVIINEYTHMGIYQNCFYGKSDMVFFEYDSVMKSAVVWIN